MNDLDSSAPLAEAAVEAIQHGQIDALSELLADNPGLARARICTPASGTQGASSRTLLHVVTDWPGHFPNGSATVAVLVAAGADVNARFMGAHSETPLHWAASSDDVAVLDALLDLGADIEALGGVIGGGPPIADAAAFGQRKAARRLVERGAQTPLWVAAALGLMDRVRGHFNGFRLPIWPSESTGLGGARTDDSRPDETTHAFWCACHGGQQAAAQFLLEHGANISWLGYDQLTPLGAARRNGARELVDWLVKQGAT